MILICIYIIIFLLIKRELKLNTLSEKKIFIFCAVLSCLLAICFRAYLISAGFKYGLANRDMQYYMYLAERVSNISIRSGFSVISSHWNFANVNRIQIWGYRFYIYFLALTVYRWTLFPTEVAVYLVSIWQLLLGGYSVLQIYNSIKDKHIIYKRISLVLMLAAPPVWYGCVRLLRECFMLLCMAMMISSVCRRDKNWGFKLLLFSFFLIVLRPYYVVFMIPMLLLLVGRERDALAINLSIFVILAIICVVLHIRVSEIVGVVLSPNFFNQVKSVMGVTSIAVKQSRTIPIITYVGSIWNIVMLFYTILNFFASYRVNYKSLCCVGLILDICMIYAITFGGASELRHKMFFVLPFIIILNGGDYAFASRKNAILVNVCLAFFLIFYTLVSLLVAG